MNDRVNHTVFYDKKLLTFLNSLLSKNICFQKHNRIIVFCKILTLGNRCQQSSTTPGQQVCVCVLCLHLTPDTWGYCDRYNKGDMCSVSHLPEYYWSLPHHLCLGHDKEEPAYISDTYAVSVTGHCPTIYVF